MLPHTCTVAHTVTHGHELWTVCSVTAGYLGITFSGGHAGSRFSRRESEGCPQHICEDVAAFIRAGAVGPMLDYLIEQDLHPRLAAAVEQAVEQYLIQSAALASQGA